ncbi:solute carrier family 22 member 3-like [Diadema antillarum]|uniref:solute carrier family 22 member 3-like n=1 Tax=Diadema antillarum TaxID=105358 RepID=UPI003A8B2A73
MTQPQRTFDDTLVELGEFGRYQIVIYGVLCLFQFVISWQTLVTVFTSGEPEHWCTIPEWSSVDCDSYGFNTTWGCSSAKREAGIPWNYTKDGEKQFASCRRYNVTGVEFSPDLDLTGSGLVGCDAGWEYAEASDGSLTVNQEFDLVCGSEYLEPLSQSLYFAGNAIGAVLCGIMADRIGRHRSLFLCLVAHAAAGVAVSFSTGMWMFLIFRVVAGASVMGVMSSAFVLANEFVGPSKRNVAGNVIWMVFSMGYMSLAFIAYYIRYWRKLYLVISVVPFVLLLFFCIIPESARWLVSKGREPEARKIMRRLAKCNKRKLSESFTMCDIVPESGDEVKLQEGLFDLLRMPRLRLYSLNIVFQMNTAIGTTNFFSNLANILCPQFLRLGKVWVPLPLLIFGSVSILAGAAAFFLPETQGKNIPETLHDAENIGWQGGRRRRRGIKATSYPYQKASGGELDVHV